MKIKSVLNGPKTPNSHHHSIDRCGDRFLKKDIETNIVQTHVPIKHQTDGDRVEQNDLSINDVISDTSQLIIRNSNSVSIRHGETGGSIGKMSRSPRYQSARSVCSSVISRFPLIRNDLDRGRSKSSLHWKKRRPSREMTLETMGADRAEWLPIFDRWFGIFRWGFVLRIIDLRSVQFSGGRRRKQTFDQQRWICIRRNTLGSYSIPGQLFSLFFHWKKKSSKRHFRKRTAETDAALVYLS